MDESTIMKLIKQTESEFKSKEQVKDKPKEQTIKGVALYEVYVGGRVWGISNDIEEAERIYEDAKENNSDCFISMFASVSKKIKGEFVDYPDED